MHTYSHCKCIPLLAAHGPPAHRNPSTQGGRLTFASLTATIGWPATACCCATLRSFSRSYAASACGRVGDTTVKAIHILCSPGLGTERLSDACWRNSRKRCLAAAGGAEDEGKGLGHGRGAPAFHPITGGHAYDPWCHVMSWRVMQSCVPLLLPRVSACHGSGLPILPMRAWFVPYSILTTA